MLNLAVNDLTVDDAKAEYKKRFLFYEPSEKQLNFHKAGISASQRLFLAGNRCGKTMAGCIETAMHLTGIYPKWWSGRRFDHPVVWWVASVSFESTLILQRYLINQSNDKGFISNSLILNIVRNGEGIKSVDIVHSSGGVSKLRFKSYDQGFTKFMGERCHGILLDEEPAHHKIYTESLMRLADVDKKGMGMLMLTMTPLAGPTELIIDFVGGAKGKEVRTPETILDGKYYITATWDDAPFFDEKSKQLYLATLKPYELEARQKGIPYIGTGLVYPIPESEFLIDPIEIPAHWPRGYALDFGFDPSPTAVLFFAIDRDSNVVYVIGEYSVTSLTPDLHVANLSPMGLNWMHGVCDPAGGGKSQTDGAVAFERYLELGLKLTKSHNAKEVAVFEIQTRIRKGQFKVFSSCRKFMEEWRSYARDDKGKIRKGNDHLMNCAEYFMLDGMPLAKNKIQHQMNHSANTKKRYF